MLSFTSPYGRTWDQNSGVSPRRSSGGQDVGPVGLGEQVLEHERVHVDQRGLWLSPLLPVAAKPCRLFR